MVAREAAQAHETIPERAQWAIEKTQPAHEKHKARLENLKGGLDLLTEILESLTVEECADFKCEEEHKCDNDNTMIFSPNQLCKGYKPRICHLAVRNGNVIIIPFWNESHSPILSSSHFLLPLKRHS